MYDHSETYGGLIWEIFETEQSRTDDVLELNDGAKSGGMCFRVIMRHYGDMITSLWDSEPCVGVEQARLAFLYSYVFGSYFRQGRKTTEEFAIKLDLLGFQGHGVVA